MATHGPTARREELGYQLEIFALAGFAIAQPLLDTFGRSLDEFVFRGADRLDVVVFALAVVFGPWLVLGTLAALTRVAGAKVRRWAQVGVLGVLAALLLLRVVKQLTGLRGIPLAVAAVVLAVGFAYVYWRFRVVGLWARYAALAPVLFLGLFVFVAPTSSLVFPSTARASTVKSTKLPRHIVFLLFDEFPTASLIGTDGHIDAARYPNFAQLASNSTWYRNYTSVSGSTPYAVPALLSGSYPRNVSATAANYPHNLFTMLGDAYTVHANEVVTALCPQSVCARPAGGIHSLHLLGNDALDIWHQQVSLHNAPRQVAAGFVEGTDEDHAATNDGPAPAGLAAGTASVPARVEQFVNDLDPGKPTLDFVHLLLPHEPWHFYPSGLQYVFPDTDPGLHLFVGNQWGPEARPAELGRQRHLLQVQYVDRVLGEVTASLRQRGMYDDSLIVVTADHGAAFTPGEALRPGIGGTAFPAKTYEQIMWAPLLIKAPHQQHGTIDDSHLQSIDLLPTIAERIGVRVPWKIDGVAADKLPASDQRTYFNTSISGSRLALKSRSSADGAAGFDRMLAKNQRAFAPNDDPRWAIYQVGPYAAAIGKPVTDLHAGSASTLDVKVNNPGGYDNVDPKSGTVPGLLLGNVVTPSDAVIAVAVNGTLAGISPTFADDAGPRRFGVLIPDFLLKPGANDVALYAVTGSGTDLTFRRLSVPGLGAHHS